MRKISSIKTKLLVLLLIAVAAGWSVDYWRYRKDLKQREKVLDAEIKLKEIELIGNAFFFALDRPRNPVRYPIDSTISLLLKIKRNIPKKEFIQLCEFPEFESLPDQLKDKDWTTRYAQKSIQRFIARNKKANISTRLIESVLLSAINMCFERYGVSTHCFFRKSEYEQICTKNERFYLNEFDLIKTYQSSDLTYGNEPIALPKNRRLFYKEGIVYINTENL